MKGKHKIVIYILGVRTFEEEEEAEGRDGGEEEEQEDPWQQNTPPLAIIFHGASSKPTLISEKPHQ